MSHYDGPAFYRQFMRESKLNQLKKNKLQNVYRRQHLNHRRFTFARDTQQLDFGKFQPEKRSDQVDLQNNPIASMTAAFHPKRHYGAPGTSPDLVTSQDRMFHHLSMSESSTVDKRQPSKEPLSVDQWSVKPIFQPDSSDQPRFSEKSTSPVSAGKNLVSEKSSADQHERVTDSSQTPNEERSAHVTRHSMKSRQPSPLGHSFTSILSNEDQNISSHLALFASSSGSGSKTTRKDRNRAGQAVSTSSSGSTSGSQSQSASQLAVQSIAARSKSVAKLTRPATNLQNPSNDEFTSEPAHHHEVQQQTVANYHFPSVNLLTAPQREDDKGLDDWILNKAEVLDKTLKAFKVDARVVNWTNGPTVTQFQVKLHLGVKVSKIRRLADDLKMALAAKDIRIEAPIPGKTTCGIEIPNPKPRPVMLSEVIGSKVFRESHSPLTIALGVDLSGHPRVADLGKMPHGLIAGATGSGKSVFINSLLISLLYRVPPDRLRMILIDPKAVELAPYNGIPHLLSPVISDPKQAAAALKWTVKEMDQRYEKLAAAGVRNIEQFNRLADHHHRPDQRMPYILIVIDELADLMMVASDAIEAYIVRITQKARAAGIHLIVATQRPSVDIVTGTIKNNIPTRVAFMVSSQVDSRTIIDTAGAEKLLGRGDMLYLGSGSSHPVRLQGCFVSSREVDRVTNFVRHQAPAHYAFQPGSLLKKAHRLATQDALMPRVLAYIAREKTVSTSKLQRVFSIGYNRAAKLIDDLEQHNYISGQQGSKPRDVYLTEADYKKLNL